MKKLSLLLALVGMIFFTSCEKENTPSSLAGTTWKTKDSDHEISFTATHATYYTPRAGGEHFTGTYTYDAPDLEIRVVSGSTGTERAVNYGRVKGHTMELRIQTFDMVMIAEFKKQ